MNVFKDKRPLFGQDPFVVPYKHVYLLIESLTEKRIAIRTLTDLVNFTTTDIHVVYNSEGEEQVWAPELHKIGSNWYIYYSSSDGYNPNHRLYVLEAPTPFGPYTKMPGPIYDVWGIDATVLETDGLRYLIWSGWSENHAAFPQHLYGALMESPNRIGTRFLLSSPEYNWERTIAPLLEGPQILKNDQGKLFISYSCDASWTQEYKVGLLEHNGGPILDSNSWLKHPAPILTGGGHGCFVGSFFIYHKKLSGVPGWQDRIITSSPFSWVNGLPKIERGEST